MFKHQIRVAYRDVTVGNHIYYARYLDLLEVTRNEMFREIGFPLLAMQEKHIIFPVVECSLRYHAAARYDDLLAIHILVSDLRKVQFSLTVEIRRANMLILSGFTRHAVTNLEERPIRMPLELYSALELHLAPSEA